MAELTRSDAEALLYREARLLDDRRFEDWVAMFTDDAIYWIPYGDGKEAERYTPITYDDLPMLKERINRLRSPAAHSQQPASRTRHLITNVETEAGDGPEAVLYANFVLYEVRLNQQRSFAGNCEYRLRLVDGEWRIAAKKVCLINGDQAIYNLTFLL
jgi:benzoate/toluate 1,2-dioxygenase beta subunit